MIEKLAEIRLDAIVTRFAPRTTPATFLRNDFILGSSFFACAATMRPIPTGTPVESEQRPCTQRSGRDYLHVSMKRNRGKVLQDEICRIPWIEEIRERDTETTDGTR